MPFGKFSPCTTMTPDLTLTFRVFLRGLALLDAPVPLPVFALHLLPYGSPVSDKGCNQSINQSNINQYWMTVIIDQSILDDGYFNRRKQHKTARTQ